MRIAKFLTILALLVAAPARPVASARQDEGDKPAKPVSETPRRPGSENPIYLFLNAPTGLEAFWKLIDRPDRVVLDGEAYRKLREASDAAKPNEAKRRAIIEALTVAGRIDGDWASLTLELRVVLPAPGPEWVPIHLDGSTLSEVREGTTDLPTRIVEDRRWQVELRGEGEHRVRVALIVPVKSTVEGKRLELAVPAVASTGLDLIVPPSVIDASAGNDEKLAVSRSENIVAAPKLQARLGPRSKLELTWRERADPAAKLPPLLEANGDLALDIERDSILARSTWIVSSIRGTVSQITVRLDEAEEILDALVDTRPVLVETRREGGRSVLVIPLAEPLRPGMSRSLTLSTRRPIASRGTVRAVLQGYAFDQAKVQSGMIAVSRTGPLFLNPTTARGLRRIDPRTELPDNLRNRADTVLAYQFNGPPFELGLSIEPAPPRIQAEERTTIVVEPRFARIQTRLDCQTSQGRVFEVQVRLPIGLEFEAVEPSEVVESTREVPIDPAVPTGVGSEVPRLLSIKLKPQTRESESDSFFLVLKGWSAIDPSRVVAVPLFQPVVDASRGGRVAVLTDRNVSADLAGSGDEPSPFQFDWSQPPADWIWPVRKPSPEQSVLWLQGEAGASSLPLKVVVRSRSIRHETTLTATVDRRGAEVVEEIACEVAFGSVSKLDLAIPHEVSDDWEIEGAERTLREPLDPEADGSPRYRVKFARDYTDSFRFRIRYRLPLVKSKPGSSSGTIKLAPIRVVEGISTGRRVRIAAEPGIEIEDRSKGWSPWASPETSAGTEAGPPIRIGLIRTDEKAGPVVVDVRPAPSFALPGLVASRLWINSTQRGDNELATSAYFWVEVRNGPMFIGLQPGSRWIRARVGNVDLAEGSVDLIKPDEYRIQFPSNTPTGPILVVIDYTTAASALADGWPSPRLLGDGVIQQSVWQAEVPGTRAGVGTPPGWVDENRWLWDGLIWQRRPWKEPQELANWLTGGNTRYRLAESLEPGDRAGRHRYLFSRVGSPVPLRFWVFSRFTLLLLCSGPILGAGLLVLSRRPPPRWIAGSALIVAFAVGWLVEPDALILILQSSSLGVILFLSAVLIQWLLERRSPRRVTGDLGTIIPAASSGSAFERPPVVASDDSTAIRVRPQTAPMADPIILTRNLNRPPDQRSTSELDLR